MDKVLKSPSKMQVFNFLKTLFYFLPTLVSEIIPNILNLIKSDDSFVTK